jgi:hypothetical protein
MQTQISKPIPPTQKHESKMPFSLAYIGLLSTKSKPLSTTNPLRTSGQTKAHFFSFHQQQLMFALRQVTLPTRRSFTTTSRIMSQKYEWMVILPDNVGALDKRMAVRE